MPRLVSDRLTLLREIGGGPAGALYLADQWTTQGPRLVVVKVLHGRPPAKFLLEQIRDEGRATAQLTGSTLTATTDLARVGGRPALVRSWVDGLDLATALRRLAHEDQSLPPRAACEVLGKIAAALELADAGAVRGRPTPQPRFHGDLKPTNVIVTLTGEVCLVDVGCGATALGAGGPAQSSARFLDPTGRSGPSADIYALGQLALELFGVTERLGRQSEVAHDRAVRRQVARLSLDGIADTDLETLRALLGRCMGWSTSSRPSATQAADLLLSIADRANGPGLATFARRRLHVWMDSPPSSPDPSVRPLGVTSWEPVHEHFERDTVTEEYPSVSEHLAADLEATTVRIPKLHMGDDELTLVLPRPKGRARLLIAATLLFALFAVTTCLGSSFVAAVLGAVEAGLLG